MSGQLDVGSIVVFPTKSRVRKRSSCVVRSGSNVVVKYSVKLVPDGIGVVLMVIHSSLSSAEYSI